MNQCQRDIATALLACFRGRDTHVARGTERGTFEPIALRQPMQPDWLAKHLAGEQCLGFYLLTPESKVWCSAIDFDNKEDKPDPQWKDKAQRLALFLQQAGLSPVVEVSASGKAAHVWLFFDEALDAWIARSFWKLAAVKCDIPLVEIYPRQDRLTGKGMGNLIRYPLWNLSRFVDIENDWQMLDPLEVLGSIARTSAAELKTIAYGLGAELKPDPTLITPTDVEANDAKVELPPRVKDRLSRQQSLLARRWAGDMAGLKDQSRSALVCAIACELVRQFVPTWEIEQALRFWCQEQGYDKGERPDWIRYTVGKAYEMLFTKVEEKSAGFTDLHAAALAYLESLKSKAMRNVPSGIGGLDDSIDGVAFGEMCIIAARPAHGKSAVALQWLDHASANGQTGLILSEEMSALQLGRRLLKSATYLREEEWPEALDVVRGHAERHFQDRKPVYITESCNTIDRAEVVLDQFAQMHGVRIAAVDYLQLLSGRGGKRSQYEEVTDISKRLKQAARRNDIALLVCCQLNREIESRTDKTPKLSDLRDTGQIEQDGDLIIFPVWVCRFEPGADQSLYSIHVAKRRNGPIREAEVRTIFSSDRQFIGPIPPINREPGEDG